ncbi:unnamed protein product [Spirodela intermedia]|uniref:DNA topoisomerase VI subunit B transducer domain-containing protein n=1 Tax=Spirodela intermedia TaxID=51605 RepID=A0ABN7EB30_SPIIN|nr:unnamed protein product [Spirodela intermedia]
MDSEGSGNSPIERNKRKKSNVKSAKKGKGSVLKQKSPAEFFAENRTAGFDNPGKSLYTTMRELVENALDSAESISVLPDIEITIEEISKSRYNSMIGLVDRERVDEELYDDFESAKAREKRLAKEARALEIEAKKPLLVKKMKDNLHGRGPKGRGDASFYRVVCKDNGRGMAHDDIPNMFGVVLSGTKYGLKQTRGKFGLGAKMALIWSKMSTGLPIEISSSLRGQSYVSFCRLDIDIHRNIPHIHKHEKRENKDQWHGAEIQVIIEGNWTTYRVNLFFFNICSQNFHYMRQLAVITPYSQFIFRFVSEVQEKNITVRFARRTDVMPPVPAETKHHPSAVDILLIKHLVEESSKQNLLQFLQHEFVNIGKTHAERLMVTRSIREMGPDFSAKMPVKGLTSQQIVRIHQLFSSSKCLKPCCGEYNLRLGIIKELHPDMVATYASSPQVFEGHPFIVEAGISLGGKDVKQVRSEYLPALQTVYHFCWSRAPMVVTRTALKRIKQNRGFVSIVSTKIPFKGTGKETLGMTSSAIKQCCLQLKSKIVKKLEALEVLRELKPGKRQRLEDDELIRKVISRDITEATFREKLTQHVEQVDYEMALEYATQRGVREEPREPIYISALEGARSSSILLHGPVFALRLIQ